MTVLLGSIFDDYYTKVIDIINTSCDAQKVTDKIPVGIKNVGHRDAIQLIPSDSSLGNAWTQFSGAELNNVKITDIKVTSQGKLQGIFASDGVFRDLTIDNITVNTQTTNSIRITGVLSGSFTRLGNTKVTLEPLRLGGGALKIYILSFKEGGGYTYGSDIKDSGVIDNRKTGVGVSGVKFTNFDMDKYMSIMRQLNETLSFPSNQPAYLDRIKKVAYATDEGKSEKEILALFGIH